ncbi:glycosyltransferase [Amycolatopsis halotolerans]|uniref:Glycosyltransferase n=1 Tax=Amycolatopsis halotolerans TaxID=330083 RepID=A0ABV7QRD1_9PSEU
MRVLCTVTGSPSHVRSLLPLIRGLRSAGNRVLVAVPPELSACLAGENVEIAPVFPSLQRFVTERIAAKGNALPPLAPEECTAAYASARVSASVQSPLWADGAAELLPVAQEFQPDLVLRDDFEFSGYLVAEALEIAHLPVPGGVSNVLDLATATDPLAVHHQALGIDRTTGGLYRHGRIDYMPPSFSFAATGLPAARAYQQPVLTSPGERLPAWLADLGTDRPLVLAAIGTALPMVAERRDEISAWLDPRAGLAAVIGAVSELDCYAVVSTSGVPTDGVAVPDHVRLADHVPQPLLLEVADLFLTHGGYSSVREAIRAGVPMVVHPRMAEQPLNGRRVEELGLGRVRFDVDADVLAEACASLLADREVGRRAAQAKRDMLSLPDLSVAVTDMEELAAVASDRRTPAPAQDPGPTHRR